MITIKEMSKMLGLSTATVSNVINGKTNQVSAATIQRVREVLEAYDYVPNMTARNLASSKSKMIGVGMVSYRENDNYLKDAFVGELMGSIEAALKKHSYFMLSYFTPDPLELARTIISWNVDGLILFGVGSEDSFNITRKFHKPKVFIDSYLDEAIADGVVITLEDEKGGYLVGRHLLEMGHRKIAYFADNMVGINLLRFKGLQRALSEAGIAFDERDAYRLEATEKHLEKGLANAYRLRERYTAFFCASDYHALVICNYFWDRGLRMPEDISIVGYDDSIYARVSRPAITTVRQSPGRKGELAVEYIFKQLEQEKILRERILLPVELIQRQSVKMIS